MDTAISLTFQIFKGDQLVRTETLVPQASQPTIKIGKLSSCHVRLDDEQVSRIHAVVEVSGPDEVSIIDLGSTRGTLVNGERVNKAQLKNGDVVVLGETRIVIGIARTEVSAQTSSPAASSRPPVPPPMPQATIPPTANGARAAALPQAAPQFGADADLQGGARAIEVAAMLGDSVIAVKHLTDPASGKISNKTRAFFIIGCAMLLNVAIAFQHGYSVAHENHERGIQWVEVDEKSPLDFRPKRLAVGWDISIIVGLLGGVAAIVIGLSRRTEELRSHYFRIGRDPGVEFPTDNAPTDSFPLVAPAPPKELGKSDGFVFSWAAGMQGEMSLAGKITPLAELPHELPIPSGARIRVESGTNSFLISSVRAPEPIPPGFLMETASFLFVIGSAVVHLGFLFLLFAIPPDPKALALDLLGSNDRLTKVQVKPPEDPKQQEDLSLKKKDDGEKSGGTGTKQANEEGKMGKKDSTRQSGQYAMKNTGIDPQLAKMQATEAASKAGILGIMRSQQGGAFAALTGTGDFSSGLDDRDVYGGLIGNEVGEMQGGWGYGLRGTGPGGGGTGLGTIGLGRYGTIGHGSGTGSGYGIGSGRGGMGGHTAKQPRVNIGNASATGDLDKNIIRRYIRQKLPNITYCYEKQLLVKQSLRGTVTTQFTINGNGSVIQVRASGMGDGTVEGCVADVIRSIQFPKPSGGGIVNVTYPFTFNPAGE